MIEIPGIGKVVPMTPTVAVSPALKGDPLRDEIIRRQASPEALRLPRLLEQRRKEFAIPNGAFETQALFDRILVWQIPELGGAGDTYGDTGIVMPERVRANKRDAAPRGVLVSAGQRALDNLRANGVMLGHVLKFIRLAPWRMECDFINGAPCNLLVLSSGDLVGSEDLRKELLERPAAIVFDEDTQQHLYLDNTGRLYLPSAAAHPDDY